MAMLERRLQVLVGADQYAGLEGAASSGNRSVAAVVREAIDLLLFDEEARRRAAAARALAWPMAEGPEPDWSEAKRQYESDIATRHQP